MPSIERRFLDKVNKDGPVHPKHGKCWSWIGAKDRYDRGLFNWKRRCTRAARAVWEMLYGQIEDGDCVLHKCDNPNCVNPDHLFLGTQVDNIEDMVAKGRHAVIRGADSHYAKLTEEEVIQIKRLYRENPIRGFAHRIAPLYGVKRLAISRIIRGISWKDTEE